MAFCCSLREQIFDSICHTLPVLGSVVWVTFCMGKSLSFMESCVWLRRYFHVCVIPFVTFTLNYGVTFNCEWFILLFVYWFPFTATHFIIFTFIFYLWWLTLLFSDWFWLILLSPCIVSFIYSEAFFHIYFYLQRQRHFIFILTSNFGDSFYFHANFRFDIFILIFIYSDSFCYFHTNFHWWVIFLFSCLGSLMTTLFLISHSFSFLASPLW